MDFDQFGQLGERTFEWLRLQTPNDSQVQVRRELDGKEIILEDQSKRKSAVTVWFEPEVAYLTIGRIWTIEVPLGQTADPAMTALTDNLRSLLTATLEERGTETSSEFFGTAILRWPDSRSKRQSHWQVGRRQSGGDEINVTYAPYIAA